MSMRKDRSLLMLVLLAASSFALMTMDRCGLREVDAVRSEIRHLATLSSWRGSATLRGLRQEITSHFEILKENEKKAGLKKKIKELEVEIIRLREIENRYDRLKKLSNFEKDLKQQEDYEPITARITGAETSKWHRTIIINKGGRDGVRAGSPVVAGGTAEGKTLGGIVGRVFHAGKTTSVVLLLNDRNSSVGGIIQRNRLHGIVRGTLPGRCVIEDISNTADVRDGDVVLSSAIGETFPKGLIIGKVVSAKKRRADFFQKIEVVPFVDISRTEEVIVLNRRDDGD